jgi:hypothetical protein
MTDPELRELRRRLDSIPRGRGRRIPLELRARVTAWVARRRKDGDGWSELVRKLGVSTLTLQRWSSSPPSRKVMLRRVEVDEPAPAVQRAIRLLAKPVQSLRSPGPRRSPAAREHAPPRSRRQDLRAAAPNGSDDGWYRAAAFSLWLINMHVECAMNTPIRCQHSCFLSYYGRGLSFGGPEHMLIFMGKITASYIFLFGTGKRRPIKYRRSTCESFEKCAHEFVSWFCYLSSILRDQLVAYQDRQGAFGNVAQ